MVGSPPPLLDATMISRLNLLHNLPRLASTAPLARLIFAQWEWPDMLPSPCLTPRWIDGHSTLRPCPKEGWNIDILRRATLANKRRITNPPTRPPPTATAGISRPA